MTLRTLEDLGLTDAPRVFLRGNPNRPGERVTRHMPGVVDPSRRPFTQGSGRLELARSIASPLPTGPPARSRSTTSSLTRPSQSTR